MKFSPVSLTICFLQCAVALGSCPPPIDDDLTVNTTSGIYTGFIDKAVPGVKQWLGIRYGKAPIGSKRFLPAEAAGSSEVHYYAREYKTICFQQSGDHTGIFWELVPEFQNQDPQGEDCLFLNVWAPKKPVAKKLPVIIWVCGGSFQEGGGHAPYQVPDHWIQRMETHIVITFNYRLNVFGFPAAKGAQLNAGFYDARLVVEWARDNIAGFGGDPERIVLWGQSAGAGLVDSYLYANSEDPIIAGAIANSGAAGGGGSPSGSFSQLAEIVGCGDLGAGEELECMQKVPALRLQSVLQSTSMPGTNITVPRFAPVVDNATTFSNKTERLEKGLVATVPLITGYTINENAAFGTYTKNQTTPPPSSGVQVGRMIACGVKAEVEARLAYGLTTYRYLFAGNFSNITPRYWLGAMHSSDLPVIFGTHYQFRGNSTELEWGTSYAMEDFWVDFASKASSDPKESGGLVWPKFSANASTIMLFGNDTKPVQLVSSLYADRYANCTSN